MYKENPDMKSHRSGRLGEEFCRVYFGISEPAYEIKSSGARTNAIVVQAWQLLEQLDKQYIIVRYLRGSRILKSGKKKGKSVYTETIEGAYQKKLSVFVVRGVQIIQIIRDYKRTISSTAKGGDILQYGKWGIVWRVPIRYIEELCEVIEDTKHYILHGDPYDPPGWMGDAVASVQGGLFSDNGKDRNKKEKEYEDDVPF